jgi:hypothetical protein
VVLLAAHAARSAGHHEAVLDQPTDGRGAAASMLALYTVTAMAACPDMGVRFTPDLDRNADIAESPSRANSSPPATQYERLDAWRP